MVNSFSANDVKDYTKEQRKEAVKEIRSKQCPMLNSMMGDYMILREQSRL